MARDTESIHESAGVRPRRFSGAFRAGCAACVTLGLVAGIVLFFVVRMSVGTIERISKDRIAADVAFGYEGLRSEGKVPPEHKALFATLYDVSQSREASVWAVLLCRVTVIDALQDGTLSPMEIKAAEKASELLAQGKGLSEEHLRRFAAEFPFLNDSLREAFEIAVPEDAANRAR